MNTQEIKELAKKYYLSISKNEVISSRMSKKGYVCLKVYNPIFKSTGNVNIAVRPQFNKLLLIVEGGIYGCGRISDFN